MQCNLTHVNNLGFLVLGEWIKTLVTAVMAMGNPTFFCQEQGAYNYTAALG
jgi:hypothetical protein